MRSFSLRLAFFVSAVTAAACSGDNFSETDVPAAGAGGAAGQAGKAGSATSGSATGGKAGSGVAGTGATGGNQSTGGKSGSSVGGADAGGSDAGGSDAGGSDGGSSVGGSSAGTGGTAGASGSNAGGKAGSGGAAGGGAGTNAGGQAGAGAGGSAGASAGGAAGANAGGTAGTDAGGSAGANGGAAGEGGAAGTTAGSGGSAGGNGGAAGATGGSGGATGGNGGSGGANPWGPGKCDPRGALTSTEFTEANEGPGSSNAHGWLDPTQTVLVWSRGGSLADPHFMTKDPGTNLWDQPNDYKHSWSERGDLFPTLLPDLKTMYLTTDRLGPSTWTIYRATRPVGSGGDWVENEPKPFPITGRKVNDREYGSYVTPDGSALYFASTRAVDNEVFETSDLDIYVQATPAVDGGAVTAIAAVNMPGVEDSHPAVSPDQRVLYFARRLDGGKHDVYVSTRFSTSEAFGVPTRVDSISTEHTDTPSWISGNYCVVLFTRTIVNGTTVTTKIHRATRSPL